MKMGLYVVYDRTAEISNSIFESRNDGTALRTYQKAVIDADEIPEEEMMLLCVGTIDHELNKVEAVYPAREIIPGIHLVDEMEEENVESV